MSEMPVQMVAPEGGGRKVSQVSVQKVWGVIKDVFDSVCMVVLFILCIPIVALAFVIVIVEKAANLDD